MAWHLSCQLNKNTQLPAALPYPFLILGSFFFLSFPFLDHVLPRVPYLLPKSAMNRATKRPANYTDYRARSPKRRKVHGTDREPGYDESPQENIPTEAGIKTSGAPGSSQETEYPARAILKERGTGGKKQYQVDWEPDPDTGRPYPPTWVSRVLYLYR